jgi:hypothetical protein
MTEKNYVVNVKNKQGTIITFRGDTALELNENIGAFINAGLEFAIGNVEAILLGTSAPVQNPVATVQAVFPEHQVTQVTSTVQQPVQDASSAAPAGAVCRHGNMTWKTGIGKTGKEWKAWMCPAPQGAADKCDPQWVR